MLELLDDVFGNIQNKMNTFLCGNSTDKCEKWAGIIEFLVVEVFLLDFFLGGKMIRCCSVKLLDSITDRDTVGESEWIWLLLEKVGQTGTMKELLSVGFTNGGPSITLHDGALTWIDHVSVVAEPISG